MKFILISFLLFATITSCDLLSGRYEMTVTNMTDDSIQITKVDGICETSQSRTLQQFESVLLDGTSRGEGSDVFLLIDGVSYIADTGYVQDYSSVTMVINNDQTYSVFYRDDELFSTVLILEL